MPDPQARQPLSLRAARFARRFAGDPEPSFADLQRIGRIDRVVSANRMAICECIALLDARPAIDRELNGSRLSALAQQVGEAQFDRVCEADVDPTICARGQVSLPEPGALLPLGEALLQCHHRSSDILRLAEIAADICSTETELKEAA